MKNKFTISNMSFADLTRVVTWAENEGWNPGLYDAKCFYNTDASGFFIGYLNDKPIAAASAVIYDDEFAFCGYYIVLPEYRHRGFGMSLIKHVQGYIGERNVGIDGVLLMVDKYKKLGFEIAHQNVRYIGQGPIPIQKRIPVVPINTISKHALNSYDRLHFPVSRANFLECWLKQPGSAGYAVVINKKLRGYGFIRPSIEGFRIGPLFADNQDIADALFTNLVQHAESSVFMMDSPVGANPAAQALAEHYQLKETFRTVRMYLKYEPNILINNVYAITSLELG